MYLALVQVDSTIYCTLSRTLWNMPVT